MRIGNRPFIVAGHSQGGEHARRLMVNRLSGTQELQRMVATYAIGFGIDPVKHQADASDIPVCTNATQTGCYVSWNALGPRAEPFEDYHGAVCVNPLTWKNDDAAAAAAANIGSLNIAAPFRYDAGVTGAQCLDDRLLVGPFTTKTFKGVRMPFGRDNFHIIDYGLFYGNLRRNALDRSRAFIAANN